MKKAISFIVFTVVSVNCGLAKEHVVCSKNLPTEERLYCQFQKDRAPEYYTGCFDMYAPLEGIERAKVICAEAYEDHKEYMKTKGKTK